MRQFFVLVTSYPKTILVLAAVAGLAAGSGLFRLTRNTSPDAFIPVDHPALALFHRVEDEFGLREPIAVGVISDGPTGVCNPDSLRRVAELTKIIQNLPYIDPGDVISLSTAWGVFFEAGMPGYDRLMKTVPETVDQAEAIGAEVLNYELYRGTLVAADGSAACILVSPGRDSDADAVYRAIVGAVDAFPAGNDQIVVAGEAAVRSHMGKAVSDDALRMNFITPIVMLGLIVLAYRTGRGAILPLAVIGGASAWALGLMGYLNVPVFIVTNGIFVIIMALGVADSLHLIGQYYEEQLHLRGRDRQTLIVDSCMALWFPLLATSLTDLAGFAALYVVGGMPPIRYFGLFTCVGVMGALLYSYLVVPAGLAVLPVRMSRVFRARQSSQAQDGPPDAIALGLARLGGIVFRRRVPILVAGAMVLGLAGWGASKLIVNDARILAFKDNHPIVQSANALNARFDGTSHLNIVLEGREKDVLLQPDVLARVEAMEAFTETLPYVGGTHSLTGWVKRAHQKLNNEDPAFYVIPDDPEDTRFYLDSLRVSPMSRLLREVIDVTDDPTDEPAYTRTNLIVRMTNSEYIHQRDVIHQLESYFAREFADGQLTATIAGRANLDYHWLKMIGTTHVHSVWLAVGCVLLLTGVMFRSVVAGLLCTGTVGCAVLVNYGIMGVTGIPLGVGTSMFASIAIGAGVDFPIHMLDRLRIAFRKPGADPAAIYRETLAFTGRVLFFTAFILAVGFLLLCVSEFRTLMHFGLLIGLSIAVSFIASAILLPAFVATFKPRVIYGKGVLPCDRSAT